MNYFSAIMNIPTGANVERFPTSERFLFKTGHKEARHAAAEIALEAETEIARLEARIRGLENALYSLPYECEAEEVVVEGGGGSGNVKGYRISTDRHNGVKSTTVVWEDSEDLVQHMLYLILDKRLGGN